MNNKQIEKKWVEIFMKQGLLKTVAEYVFHKIEKDIKSSKE